MNISEDMIRDIVEKVVSQTMGKVNKFEKEVDKSGILVVRTETVKAEKFEHGERVYVTDVVTLEESPRMGAGVMELDNTDFEWTLTYDEFDYVIEGTLEIEIDGRTIVANKGDLVYIPKNSAIHFKTPNFARYMFFTYPADWNA